MLKLSRSYHSIVIVRPFKSQVGQVEGTIQSWESQNLLFTLAHQPIKCQHWICFFPIKLMRIKDSVKKGFYFYFLLIFWVEKFIALMGEILQQMWIPKINYIPLFEFVVLKFPQNISIIMQNPLKNHTSHIFNIYKLGFLGNFYCKYSIINFPFFVSIDCP